MKGVENKREFNNMKALIDYYMDPNSDAMVHSDGTTINLGKVSLPFYY